MSMDDLMKALLQSAPSGAQKQAAGSDALSQMLGGLLSGGQSGTQQAGGSGDMMSQVLGGLMGGGQQTSNSPAGSLLGGLEQIIGGQPGSGQALSPNQGMGMNMGMNDPLMLLLQPVVNQLAAKVNIPPQIAMVVVSIAIHYLISSHSSTGGNGPLNLDRVVRELGSGGISQSTLRNSGMVNDVMQATGMNKQDSINSLNATFGVLGASVKGSAGGKRG